MSAEARLIRKKIRDIEAGRLYAVRNCWHPDEILHALRELLKEIAKLKQPQAKG